jgi:DNA-binding GntR family transcriptional regulator
VYRALRDAICDGSIRAHDHLAQNQIAGQLRVSRTPVRDALLRLAQEGVIHAVGQRGYVVTPLVPRDILDIYEVRMTLEVQAAELAFPFIDAAQIARMESLNDLIAQPGEDVLANYDLNRDFHAVLTGLCPNRLVRRILDDVWALPVSRRVYRQHMTSLAGTGPMVSQHREIIGAARDHDQPRLLAAIRRHLEVSRAEAGAWLNESGEPGD